MATNLSTCRPGDGIEGLNRLPGLAEPLLQIDLDRELQQLRREDSWQRETGRSSKTLAKYPDFRIVLILMKGGTRMRRHRAEGRILEKTNPNCRLICNIEMSKSDKEWKGEVVVIDREMLSRHLVTLPGPIYYSAGPTAMAAGMRAMLVSAGVDEDDIRTEDFAGY